MPPIDHGRYGKCADYRMGDFALGSGDYTWNAGKYRIVDKTAVGNIILFTRFAKR